MNKRTERLAALALFLLCAAIVWSQLDAHVRAQTSIPGPGSADPGKCSNPWITTIDTTSGADTSLALTGCVSETCKRVVVDNVGSNPVLIQVNSSTGTSGIWLAGATAHPEMMHSVDLSFGPAVTAIYKSTTGATAPAAYGTTGASETVVTACD